ncbi:hypothetical protein Syun_016789 [Stephania yunnanensis]|uniref:Uncharacterized protein n=1 Tax=Stephania yunnanensis TaxID=152371 RepID=A0AAP0J5E6_9MAGN
MRGGCDSRLKGFEGTKESLRVWIVGQRERGGGQGFERKKWWRDMGNACTGKVLGRSIQGVGEGSIASS